MAHHATRAGCNWIGFKPLALASVFIGLLGGCSAFNSHTQTKKAVVKPAPADLASVPRPSGPEVLSYRAIGNGVIFRLPGGESATLTVRSPLAVRLAWSPVRKGKIEDWLIVPPTTAPPSLELRETGGELVISTGALTFSTPTNRLQLRAFDKGRAADDLSLRPGQPLKVEYAADFARFYEDEHDYVWAYAPSRTRLELLTRYGEATGFSPMPPKWVMGIAYGSYGNESDLPRIAGEWRDWNLPIDAIWGDGGVFNHRAMNDFGTTWKPASLKRVRDLNFMLGRWIMQSTKPGATTWDEFSKHPWLATSADGKPLTEFWADPIFGSCPDPFNPEAREFFKQAHSRNQGLNAGFNFFKVDFREVRYPTFFCFNHTIEVPRGFASTFNSGGGTNQAWRLLLSRATFEATRDQNDAGQRGWVITKYPVPGYQRYYCVWPDDHKGEFEDLTRSVATMLAYSREGIPWYCDDLGGYNSKSKLTKELFIRWAQYGVFTPWPTFFAQNAQRVPWVYDTETVDIFRRYDELRYRLSPYLYSYAHQANVTGRPIAVPLDLAFPDDPEAARAKEARTEFLFGGELLIAPVLKRGAVKSSVYLPARCDWFNFDTGERLDGGQVVVVDSPLSRMPIFVRGNAIIPMAKAGRQFIADGGLLDDTITWNLYPSKEAPAGSFELYEDDGKSAEYRKGRFGITRIKLKREGRATEIDQSPTAGEFAGRPTRRNYVFRINGVESEPGRVELNSTAMPKLTASAETPGTPSGYAYDAAAKVVWVRVECALSDSIKLKVD